MKRKVFKSRAPILIILYYSVIGTEDAYIDLIKEQFALTLCLKSLGLVLWQYVDRMHGEY